MALDGFRLEEVKYVLRLYYELSKDVNALESVQIKIFTLTIFITENSRTCARQTFAWRSN